MSTSKLQRKVSRLLSTHLGQHTIRENYRPEWLCGLELDFYVEELDIAIEVQGEQHYRFIPHFHLTWDGFRQQVCRDAAKKTMCSAQGITLYAVVTENEALNLIEKIAQIPVSRTAHLKALEQEAIWREEDFWTDLLAQPYIKKWLRAITKFRRMIAAAKPKADMSTYQKAIENRKEKVRRHLGRKGYKPDVIEHLCNTDIS